MKLSAILILLYSTCALAQQQQLPPASNINGRMQSLSSSLNAAINQCAAETGALHEALEKQQQEITKLKAELEAKSKEKDK